MVFSGWHDDDDDDDGSMGVGMNEFSATQFNLIDISVCVIEMNFVIFFSDSSKYLSIL